LDLIRGLPSGPAACEWPQTRPHTCKHSPTRYTEPKDFSCVTWGVHTCCTDRLVNALRPYHAFRLGDADGLRASKLEHAVEGMSCNGNFGRATPIRS
jgi:hypothetical protein